MVASVALRLSNLEGKEPNQYQYEQELTDLNKAAWALAAAFQEQWSWSSTMLRSVMGGGGKETYLLSVEALMVILFPPSPVFSSLSLMRGLL